MAQDTLYFPHDYNPFDDIMFDALVAKHGVVGYGVFWRLVEMLHTNSDHLLRFEEYIFEAIAIKFSIETELVQTVVEDCIGKYRLFQANGEFFWSERVFRNIKKRKEISEKRSKAGKASSEQRRKDREIADLATHDEHVSTSVEHLSTKKERKKERNYSLS